MESNGGSVRALFDRLTAPQFLTEMMAVLIAALIAWAATSAMRGWMRRRPALADDTTQARFVEGCVTVAPFLFALAALLAIRATLDTLGTQTAVLDTALQLIAALILVRCAVFALRLTLGEQSWLRTWETRIATLLWVVISFELLGWFEAVERTLDSIDLLPGKATFSLWALLRGVVVVTGFVLVTTLVARTLERRILKLDAFAMSTRIGISKFVYFFLVSLGILMGINSAGVDLTALTVLTGAIGLGLGFGLQAITSNFVSGFVLLMDKSIKPGDVISFTGTTGTSTENFGWVQELRGRYIVVRDRDGVDTLVPNQHVITNSVINWSYSDARVRLRLPVMISYQDDPEIALRLLLEAARDHPRILKEPSPVSRLMSFEDYGMRVEVRFWIADPMNGVNNVRSDVNRFIFKLFRANGVTIPVAQRELRMLPPVSEHADRHLPRDHDPGR